MNWRARVYVRPKEEVLDPQGQAIHGALQHLELTSVQGVRSGRLFDLDITAVDRASAQGVVQQACERLLANTVVETYDFDLQPAADAAKAP